MSHPNSYISMKMVIFDTTENMIRCESLIHLYTCIWKVHVNTLDMVFFSFLNCTRYLKEILNFSVTLENNNNGCCLRNGIFVWSMYSTVLILSTKHFLQMFQAKHYLINKRLEYWKAWPYNSKIVRFDIWQFEIFQINS